MNTEYIWAGWAILATIGWGLTLWRLWVVDGCYREMRDVARSTNETLGEAIDTAKEAISLYETKHTKSRTRLDEEVAKDKYLDEAEARSDAERGN